MNENEMLNDNPIFVAKARTSHGLILAAMGLMIALVLYLLAQESEADKLKLVVGWLFGVFCGVGGVVTLYQTLIFKKIYYFKAGLNNSC